MSDQKPPLTELERLKKLGETLDRTRLKNRQLAREGGSLIADFLSKGRQSPPPPDPKEFTK